MDFKLYALIKGYVDKTLELLNIHPEKIVEAANDYTNEKIAEIPVTKSEAEEQSVITNNLESNKAFGDYSFAEGNNTTAGSMSYKIIGIDPEFYYDIFLQMTEEEFNILQDFIESSSNPIEYSMYLTHQYNGRITGCSKREDSLGNFRGYCITIDKPLSESDIGIAIKDTSYLTIIGYSKTGNQIVGTGAHAEGYNTQAQGLATHAEGYNTIVYAKYGHAEGHSTVAGHAAHAEGQQTKAYGQQSHAEGIETQALGIRSHAEGSGTTAIGGVSHSEGSGTIAGQRCFNIGSIDKSNRTIVVEDRNNTLSQLAVGDVFSLSYSVQKYPNVGEITNINDGTKTITVSTIPSDFQLDPVWSNRFWVSSKPTAGDTAIGDNSHSEGKNAKASGEGSHSEGNNTNAGGDFSHAEGNSTIASGFNSHAEGKETVASGYQSHAEGSGTKATNWGAHAEGNGTTASGEYAHSEGLGTLAQEKASHAENYFAKAYGYYSHAEGNNTQAIGESSHAEGKNTIASGPQSHAEGSGAQATNWNTHAEGVRSVASGEYSHAEGTDTTAEARSSHSEGENSHATAPQSHAEGNGTTASGGSSHSEGNGTTASGGYSHAEGNSTTASGEASHAEGKLTQALGYQSHTEGNSTIAPKDTWNQHVQGRFNQPMDLNYAHVVGNGTSEEDRRNAHTLDWNGNAWYAGKVETTGIIIKSATKKFLITVDDNGTLSTTEIV